MSARVGTFYSAHVENKPDSRFRKIDDTSLIVDVVVNGDTDNPLRVKSLIVDTTAGTFSSDVSGVPTGTSTLLLVYSITVATPLLPPAPKLVKKNLVSVNGCGSVWV